MALALPVTVKVVFSARIPPQVFEPVVGFVAVPVAAEIALRSRAYEGAEHKDVDGLDKNFGVPAKIDRRIPVAGRRRLQELAGLRAADFRREL